MDVDDHALAAASRPAYARFARRIVIAAAIPKITSRRQQAARAAQPGDLTLDQPANRRRLGHPARLPKAAPGLGVEGKLDYVSGG